VVRVKKKILVGRYIGDQVKLRKRMELNFRVLMPSSPQTQKKIIFPFALSKKSSACQCDMGNSSLQSATSAEEQFKDDLLNDVFNDSSQHILDMEKVTMIIWKFRQQPDMVRFVGDFLAKVRHVTSCHVTS